MKLLTTITKTPFLLLTIMLFCMNINAQIVFEQGYFINEQNQRIECYIKNLDWLYNPSSFEYRLSDTSEVKTARLEQLLEFGIHNFSRYVRAEVRIDRSEDDLRKLDTSPNPNWQQETLFLKVLVEGEATLFVYEESGFRRFFFSVNNSDIQQLVHKTYVIGNNQIRQNNQFRQQILTGLPWQSMPMNDINRLQYTQKQLVRLFSKYNNTHNAPQIVYGDRPKRNSFNLSARPGINHSTLALSHLSIPRHSVDFGSLTTFRMGVELEYLLPFNKNKWAVILEPTYQYFEASQQRNHQTVVVDYTSIEMPLGIRHYFFLSPNSQIFLNASLIVDLSRNSTISYSTGWVMEIFAIENYGLGIGYKLNNRFAVELRYHTNRQLLTEYVSWSTQYQTASFILGYRLY